MGATMRHAIQVVASAKLSLVIFNKPMMLIAHHVRMDNLGGLAISQLYADARMATQLQQLLLLLSSPTPRHPIQLQMIRALQAVLLSLRSSLTLRSQAQPLVSRALRAVVTLQHAAAIVPCAKQFQEISSKLTTLIAPLVLMDNPGGLAIRTASVAAKILHQSRAHFRIQQAALQLV